MALIFQNIFFAVTQYEIALEAVNDVLWGDFPFLKVLESAQEYSPEGLVIILNMLLTLIKHPQTEYNGFINHTDIMLEIIKSIREKLENDEFPSRVTAELKKIVELLLIWLEAYNLIKHSDLIEVIRSLWSNLPTASSFNISFHDCNFQSLLKQLFGVAYVLPSCLPQFFLGCSETSGSAIIFFSNAYRSLSNLLEVDPDILFKMLESGLLSHVRHILLSLSNCLQQWTLPNAEPSEDLSPILAFNDYLELLFQIFRLLNQMLPRCISTHGYYDDSITLSSTLIIFSHVLNKSLESHRDIEIAVLDEILGVLSAWIRQENFLNEILIPKLAEFLVDLPIRRTGAIYLLMSITGILNIKMQEKLSSLQQFLFSRDSLCFKRQKGPNGEDIEEEQKESFPSYVMRLYGSMIGYILNELYTSYEAKFLTVGICMLKQMVNTLDYEFAEELLKALSDSILSFAGVSSHIDEFDLVETPTSAPNNKLIFGLCRRLLILNELIPSMFKYTLLRSSFIDKILSMFQSFRTTGNLLARVLERYLLETLQSLCTVNSELFANRYDLQYAACELLPSVPHMQKLMNLLSQRAIIDPHTFTGLANGSIEEPLIILEYLNTIKVFISSPIGRSIALFSDNVSIYSSALRTSICFKELIDQCHELLKLRVPIKYLVPVISSIMDIALLLTIPFDTYGMKIDSDDAKQIPLSIINGISCILAGDVSSLTKLSERLDEFTGEIELAEKWEKLAKILSTTEYAQEIAIDFYKNRPIDQIYKSYEGSKLVQTAITDLLKPKTIKQAESIYAIKHKSKMNVPICSVLGVSLMLSYHSKLSNDWLVERLNFLESSVISYFANGNFIIKDMHPRIIAVLNETADPEKLEVEHDNLLFSIQTVKRRQRMEVEKKRCVRTKATPAVIKLAASNMSNILPRKTTAQQPSRNISTHVDVFEGLDKGTKSPFPVSQRIISGKPSTPTQSAPPSSSISFVPQPVVVPIERPPIDAIKPIAMPQPIEDKPAIASKFKNLISLLNRIKKSSTKSSSPLPQRFPLSHQVVEHPSLPLFSNSPTPPASIGSQDFYARINQVAHESGLPASTIIPSQSYLPAQPTATSFAQFTEEEKEACRKIQYMKQQRPNDPRTQEFVIRMLKQYKRIGPYVMNTPKKF